MNRGPLRKVILRKRGTIEVSWPDGKFEPWIEPVASDILSCDHVKILTRNDVLLSQSRRCAECNGEP